MNFTVRTCRSLTFHFHDYQLAIREDHIRAAASTVAFIDISCCGEAAKVVLLRGAD